MSSFGTFFKISTFGESHGKGVGVIVDGVPPTLKLTESDIQVQLDRRRPGQSALTTARNEADQVVIQSGTQNGVTLGSPISLFVPNMDQRPGDYSSMASIPRPSHADYTYQMKYGVRVASGGGRSSARETIGRVAAGAIAEKWLREAIGIEIVAWVSSVGSFELPSTHPSANPNTITRQDVDAQPSCCPDKETNDQMTKSITDLKDAKDSIGGVVSCVCRNVPSGWGEPCFDKLEAKLAHAMMSIPATKGFEIGSGFAGTAMTGSSHNDPFVTREDGTLGTSTNNSGGIQGGVSNGEHLVMRMAFKPPATIGKNQDTVNFEGQKVTLEAKGRHDPCVVPRAIPIVEAMAALVLADAALMQLSRNAARQLLQREETEGQLPPDSEDIMDAL